MEREINYKWNLNENGHVTSVNAQKIREFIGNSQKKYSQGP
jgi:hypothetical protein